MKTFSLESHRLLCRNISGLLTLALLGLAQPAAAQLLRSQAVDALLAPGSGVTIFTDVVAVWSPYADLGGGPGREGMVPAGTTVGPRFEGPQTTVTAPSYFFWIDDAGEAKFAHATRFVLVRADVGPTPTVANGGITVREESWWPLIHLTGELNPREYFSTLEDRLTAFPPGPGNPDGLVAGVAPAPGDLTPPPWAPVPPKLLSVPASMMASSNAAGLVISGDNGAAFSNDVRQYEGDLTNHYGIPSNRVVKANGGAAANSNQVAAAVTALCALMPPPDKIYLRVTTHGNTNVIKLGNQILTGEEFCRLIQPLATKGVPICMLLDCCLAESLVPTNLWGFPVNSVIIVSSSTNRSAFGGALVGLTGSAYSDAFSKCLNNPASDSDGTNGVTEKEAHQWVTNQNPCYKPSALQGGALSNVMIYPAGDPSGWPAGTSSNVVQKITNCFPNPGPKVFVVTPPRLEIKKSNDNQIDLRWPINPPHFEPEWGQALPASWQPLPFTPTEDNGYKVVQFPISFFGPQAFFRLSHQPPTGDTTPPTLVSAQVVAPAQVKVTFSEQLDPATANQPSNYQLFRPPGQQIPVVGANLTPDGTMVILQLGGTLQPATGYTVVVNNVRDLAGNQIAPNSMITFMTP